MLAPSSQGYRAPPGGRAPQFEKHCIKRLSAAYFRAATVGNAVKGFKNCGIEDHNLLAFSKHDFAASKAADHDVVADETENNSANLHTLIVEKQHINLPEEPELMVNADYDALKKPVSVFFISNHCLKQHNARKKANSKKPNSPDASNSKDGVIRCPACQEEYCDSSTEELIQCSKCQEWWHEECCNYENGTFICDYC
ncbi:uncharacterized protein TNCV_4269021 [Trichonephila clavipes]|nr:uncharacterized protein TNCV_4269021 [Trichonephila clavipes]